MIICPNLSNPDVAREFNELKEATSEKAAYAIWSLNNGNHIDRAPNGAPSILFQTYLDLFEGDRVKAIVAKSKVYSNNFLNWFGDWINNSTKSDATERLIDKLNSIVNSDSKFSSFAKLILDNKALPYNLKYFKIDNNRNDIEGHSAMWNSLVNLIEVLGNNVSEEEINKALLHELIHYNTENILSLYKTSPDNVPQSIRQNVKELYSIIDYAKKYIIEHFDEKKFREVAERQNKNIGSRLFYAFNNQGDVEIDEFISEIFTNPGLQEILNEIPYKETKQTLWDRIKECIHNIFGIPINKGSVLEEALKASTEFITKTEKDYNSVSKVVDENGEPLVVYHTVGSSEDLNRIQIFDRNARKSRGKWLYYFSSNKQSSQSYLRKNYSAIFDKEKTYEDVLSDKELYYPTAIKELRKKKDFDEAISFIKKELDRIVGLETTRKLDYNGLLVNYNHFDKQTEEDKRIAFDYNKLLYYLEIAKSFRESDYTTQEEWATHAFFLNIKNPFVLNAEGKNWDEFEEYIRNREGKYIEDYYLYNREASNNDGLEIDNYIDTKDYKDERQIISSTFGVAKSNQIKSATDNNGMFSTENDNTLRYYGENTEQHPQKPSVSKLAEPYTRKVQLVSDETIGKESAEKLNNGESASSSDIISNMLEKDFADLDIIPLLRILKFHNVPIVYGDTQNGNPAEILIKSDGTKVIVINENISKGITNRTFSEVIAHEMIHATTYNLVHNPKTDEEIRLSKQISDVYELLKKLAPSDKFDYTDTQSGFYLLQDKDEFLARFLTDKKARQFAYALVKNKARHLNAIKRFINNISNFLFNRNIFKGDISELNQLKSNLIDYLQNIDKIDINITKKLLDEIFDSIEDIVVDNEDRLLRDKLSFVIKENWKKLGFLGFKKISEENRRKLVKNKPSVAIEDLNKLSKEITTKLKLRKRAIEVSNKDELFKITNQLILQSLITMFETESNFVKNIDDFLFQLLPQLAEDSSYILKARINEGVNMSSSEYKYMKHDNIEAYSIILNHIQDIFKNRTMVDNLRKQLRSLGYADNQIDTKLSEIELKTKLAIIVINNAKEDLKDILKNVVVDILINRGNELEDQEMLAYIDIVNRDIYTEDVGKFYIEFGAKEYSANKDLRFGVSVVNNLLFKSLRESYDKAVNLLTLVSKLKYNESILDLFEKDSDGKTTQYLIRDVNFGVFLDDYNNFLIQLNKSLGLPESNRVSPEDEDLRIKWNKERNKWLSIRCEREYTPEYYEKYENISQLTLNAITKINAKINQLNSIFYRDDLKCYIYDNLTGDRLETYNKLVDYQILKKQLYDEYDVTGNRKTGVELLIALELKQLNKDLYKNESDIEYNYDEWLRQRNQIILDSLLRHGTDDINDKRVLKDLHKWDYYNSRLTLKKDQDGRTVVWSMIEQELKDLNLVYEYENDGGKTYDDNKEKIRELLKPYLKPNGDGYYFDKIPKDIKRKVIKLENDNFKIRSAAESKNRSLKDNSLIRKKIMDKYVKFVETEEYKLYADQFIDEALEEGMDYDFAIQMLEEQSGRPIGDPMWGDTSYMLYKWFSKMDVLPQDKLPEGVSREDLVEITPGNGFIVSRKNMAYKNPRFDDSYGERFIPKKQFIDENGVILRRYDNTKAYKKVQDSINKNGALGQLYNEVLNINQESYSNYGNSYNNKYFIPKELGTIYKRTKHNKFKDKLKVLWDVICEKIGTKKLEDEEEYGQDINSLLTEFDEFGQPIEKNDDFEFEESGVRADGTPINILPRIKLGKMQDPSALSSDLIYNICTLYRSSLEYKYKQEVLDDLDIFQEYVDNKLYIKKWKYKVKKEKGETVKKVVGGYLTSLDHQTNTSKALLDFNDTHLYGKTKEPVKFRIFNKYEWDAAILMRTVKIMTTAMNLALNPVVAGKAIITSFYKGAIEGVMGLRYGKLNFARSIVEIILTSIKRATTKRLPGLGDSLANDVSTILMERWNISGQFDRKIKHSHLRRSVRMLGRGLNHFNMLSYADNITKKGTTIATLLGHHYYKGEFITYEDLLKLSYGKSKGEFKLMKDEWKSGVNAYDVLTAKKGNILFKGEYKEAWEKCEKTMQARSLKTSERWDGMATQTQKANAMRGILLSAALIHRQYLPLMLSERFGKTVYDVDTHYLENGMYRNAFSVVYDLFGSIFIDRSRESVKLVFNIRNAQSQDEFNRAITKQRHIKQIVLELSLYYVFGLLTSYVSGMADDDKDDYLLNLIAYMLRSAEWEIHTPYNILELINAFKSPSAALTTTDRAIGIANGVTNYAVNTIFPRGSLLDWFSDSATKKDKLKNVYKRGLYEGKNKDLILLFKMLPIHNLYEQYYDARTKDRYFENQIMRLNKESEQDRYKFMKSIFDPEETRTIE